jgi:hypothetical protein
VGGYLKIARSTPRTAPRQDDEAGHRHLRPLQGDVREVPKEAGKKHLIPYFIAAHPGTTDEDMMNLALWLKANNFKLDQVQTFMPTPMAMATTMYHSARTPAQGVGRIPRRRYAKSGRQRRRLQGPAALPRPGGWPLIREACGRWAGRPDRRQAEASVPRTGR